MSREQIETAMVHYECFVCHITATCVANSAAELAWWDHMNTHVDNTHYGAWSWTVIALPLDQG